MNGIRMGQLDRVSAALLAIHQLPGAVPFERFQDEALGILKGVLPFDAAWWGLVSGLSIHTAVRHNLPPGFRRRWETISRADPIAPLVLATPFVTVAFNEPDLKPHP